MANGDNDDSSLSRRHLLRLATYLSVGATVSGCASANSAGSAGPPSTGPGGPFGGPAPGSSKTADGTATASGPAIPDSLKIADLLSVWPFHVAHRGGSANWPEMTLAAYDNSYRNGMRALEISLHRSADGVFVCSHDDDLSRVTVSSLSISQNSWSTLRGLKVRLTEYTSAPAPSPSNQKTTLCRLEDVLDRYAQKCVLFIEDKTQQHSAALMRILKRYPGIEDRVVWKVHNSVQEAALAAGRENGLTTWGYFFAREMDKFDTMAPRFSWLGVDYRCTAEQLTKATSLGKTTVGHIVHNPSQYQTLLEAGCNGIMLGNVARMPRRNPF